MSILSFLLSLAFQVKAQELKPVPIIHIRQISLNLEAKGKWGGQCVAYIQQKLGLAPKNSQFRGYAGDIEPTSSVPGVGRAILISYENEEHAGLVTRIEDNTVYFEDSNFHGDEIIGNRTISVFDMRIRGYYDFSTESSMTDE